MSKFTRTAFISAAFAISPHGALARPSPSVSDIGRPAIVDISQALRNQPSCKRVIGYTAYYSRQQVSETYLQIEMALKGRAGVPYFFDANALVYTESGGRTSVGLNNTRDTQVPREIYDPRIYDKSIKTARLKLLNCAAEISRMISPQIAAAQLRQEPVTLFTVNLSP